MKAENYLFNEEIFTRHSGSIFYWFNPDRTYTYNEREREIETNKTNLSFARKIILDDRYPIHEYLWLNQDIYEDEEGNKCDANYNSGVRYGRSELVNMIGLYEYNEALPELRELLLYETSKIMRFYVLKTLNELDQRKSNLIINEVLGRVSEKELLTDLIMHIQMHTHEALFIKNLHKIFEEHYYCFDVSKPSSRPSMGREITQSVLLFCEFIFTLESLDLIEKGLTHPYPPVEKTAVYAFNSWMRGVQTERKQIIPEKVMTKARQLEKKYQTKDRTDIKLFYNNVSYVFSFPEKQNTLL